MADTAIPLTAAIEKAVETHKEEIAQDQSAVKVEQIETTTEPPVVEEEPVVDEEAEQGRILVQALKDPARAGQVIEFLAKQAGYTKSEIKTTQDVKEVKADITAILKEELGEEFAFLAPKFGKALERALKEVKVENTQTPDPRIDSLQERVNAQENKEIQTAIAEVHTQLAQDFFGSDDMPQNVITAMSKAMDEFPPTDPSMSPKIYYRKIFSLVAGELGLQKRQGTRVQTIERNKTDAPVRQLSANKRGLTPINPGVESKMTLQQAVELAQKQVDKALSK